MKLPRFKGEAIWVSRLVPNGFWNSKENRRNAALWLAGKLRWEHYEDFYQLGRKHFQKNSLLGLLSRYKFSPRALVKDLLPEFDSIPWLFREVPPKFWDVLENQQEYLAWLLKKLGFTSEEDMYRLQKRHFLANRGPTLIQDVYGGSVVKLLRALRPDFQLAPWLMVVSPMGFWQDRKNRLEYLKWLGQKMGWKTQDDWSGLRKSILLKNHGAQLYRVMGRSIHKILSERFRPNIRKSIVSPLPKVDRRKVKKRSREFVNPTLLPKTSIYPLWLYCQRLPTGFWSDRANRRGYLLWLADFLGWKYYEDFYGPLPKYLKLYRGWRLLRIVYDGSTFDLLRDVLPEYKWVEWEMERTKRNFWKSKQNRVRFVKHTLLKLGLDSRHDEDLYKLTMDEMEKNGGGGLSSYYKHPIEALREAFPDRELREWLMRALAPAGFWSDQKNVLRYLEWLAQRIGIKEMQDWYNADGKIFKQNYGDGLKQRYGSLYNLLKTAYPNFDWDASRLGKIGSKNQSTLYRIIRHIIPKGEILYNYKHPGLRFSRTNRPMELDIFLPEKNFAIEYQGEQHFADVKRWKGSAAGTKSVRMRDREKREACKRAGITLIEFDFRSQLTLSSVQHVLLPFLNRWKKNE